MNAPTKEPGTLALRTVMLRDRTDLQAGTVLVNGNQALVRALLMQRERDRRAGLHTAGYVSGYRGSPLGGLDQALWAAQAVLQAADVSFEPGVNEELAATAVWGTQQLAAMGDATVDGVFGLWYGKGPGVDRAGDALKHGNYAGSHPQGGVLVVAGDDHQGKSSTVAHHSQQALAAHSIPVLYPADVGEFVAYALLGWALSRYSGCWVGFKVVNETAEQAMTCSFDLAAFELRLPDAQPLPPEGVHYRGSYTPALDELILRRWRLPLVQRFAHANRIDRTVLGDDQARFGIVTAGKCWHEVRGALRALGLDSPERATALGLAVYKVGLIWPLEPEGLAEFAAAKQELLFVEDKTAFVEAQAAAILYPLAQRPRITGKRDADGRELLSSDAGFEPLELALVIARRLQACGLWDEALQTRWQALQSTRSVLLAVAVPGDLRRTPFFCSGCPHGRSTRVPEGSRAMAGIGCHGMAMFARPGTLLPSQMGGEGLTWVGLRRYTRRKHVFQNLGDGTYYHSGLLAIRAAVASGANITYKILYNDAVAMTGGQPVDGPVSVARIAHQVLHEGIRALVLVSDDPSRHAAADLPAGVRIEHRDRLDAVQRALRETPGCTVLLYEQTCAAELRRRRKRGELPEPDRRLFINAAVCEGCGDCSEQSSCVSIEPHDTPLGRKRRINQSSCNRDFSCAQGFCPSFVSVIGGQPRRAAVAAAPEAAFAALPQPAVAPLGAGTFGVMIPGIGGTGVITVGAVLAMAAHLEGKAASTYDMTGLSQKNGAVYSHLQVAASAAGLGANRLGLGDADLVLGFDMVAAVGDEAFRTIDPSRTRFVGNLGVLPTAMQALDPAARVDFGLLARKVSAKLAPAQVRYVDANGLATRLLGDSIGSNFFLVGAALQLGWLPVGLAALERAIELNGVQVAFNLNALRLGRLWVHDERTLRAQAGLAEADAAPAAPETLAQVTARGVSHLTAYQDAAYALRYQRLVDQAAAAEAGVAGAPGAFSLGVATQALRLMAYKDEYEVARLYSSPDFRQSLTAAFDDIRALRFHLAPPLWARRDARTGQLQKREYGAWMLRAMGWLARLRGLRGTLLDPFGYQAERRVERRLVQEFTQRIAALLPGLSPASLPLAIEIAETAQLVRGFGHVKQANLEGAEQQWALLQQRWSAQQAGAAPGPQQAA